MTDRPIFEPLLSLSQFEDCSEPISFAHQELEHSSVIALALHYIDGREVSRDREPMLMLFVLAFGRKWRFHIIPELVQAWVQGLANRSDFSARATLSSAIAMYMDFRRLLTRLLELGEERLGNPTDDMSDLEHVLKVFEGTILLVPISVSDSIATERNNLYYDNIFKGMSYSSFKALPSPWVWSIVRNHWDADEDPEEGEKSISDMRKSAMDTALTLCGAHGPIESLCNAPK